MNVSSNALICNTLTLRITYVETSRNVCIDDTDKAFDVQWCAETESDIHCEPATLTFETIAPQSIQKYHERPLTVVHS